MKKRVLVTGASRGIGKAICERFLKGDWEVLGLARKETELSRPLYECDVADEESLASTFQKICETTGSPDVLVNNAGLYCAASWDEESIEQFDRTMIVNARAVFQLCQLFGRRLQTEGKAGAIVNVSSISGRIGSVDPAYAASKAAVDALTKSFARGLANVGIRVNAVCPGPVNTEMASRIPEERQKEYQRSILQARFGEPEEIANLVYFLAGDEASLLTGEIYYATGGIL